MKRLLASSFLQLAIVLAFGSAESYSQERSKPQILPVEAQWCLKRGYCIDLELADKVSEQRLGLQFRPQLPPNRGMWFQFRPAAPARFWMYLTPQPLDMIFIRNGKVIGIVENAMPCPEKPCQTYGNAVIVDDVVELRAGQASKLDISIGTAFTPVMLLKPQ